jgi:hypothetical protein
MKQLIFILPALVFSSQVFAQTAVTTASGTGRTSDGAHITFSIGEMSNVCAIQTSTSGELKMLTQGFLQPSHLAVKNRSTAVTPKAFTMNIMPNPVVDQLRLQGNWEATDKAQCMIHDASGKLIQTSEPRDNTVVFDLGNCLPGVYFLTLTTGEQSQTQRFVKIK